MARKIAVLDRNSSLISHHVKRATARHLIADLLFEWVIEGESIRQAPPELRRLTTSSNRRCRGYIPDRMPPVELPQLHFQEPLSATWRQQHRQVA